MTLTPGQWAFAVVAAFIVGVSKTGVGGLGMLAVILFAQIMPAKQATGVVLPLLCFGDLVAVGSYRQHAKWTHLWRVFPWAAAGVVVGYFALGRMSEREAKVTVAVIVLTLVTAQIIRRRMHGHETEHGAWFAPTIGILAGFTTLVANASGPLMAVYLLAMGLPKMDYMGTAAVFFMLINLFKVPFMVSLGLINTDSFTLNLRLAAAVFAGTLVGRKLLTKIDQRLFENLALGLAAAAGVRLLF